MLIHELYNGAAWVDSSSRLTNTTGTPVVSAPANFDGRAIADTYFLVFSAVVAGVSANVTVTTSSPNNPYRHTKAVLLDGVTIHKDVIPGLSLIFSALGGFTAAWAAEVEVGEFLGTFDAFGAGAGLPLVATRYRVRNTGTGTASVAKARILPNVKWVKKIGTVFSLVKPFAEGSTEKQAGGGSVRVMPYVLTIANVTGVGGAKTAEVRVDGVMFPANSLRDESDSSLHNGAAVKAVAPGNVYQVVLGPLTGLEFTLDAGVANGDTANVLIFAPRFRRIAPETAPNVAGVYATADVDLTEDGQPAGQILPGAVAYYWADIFVPSGGNPSSNPHPTEVAIVANESGQAGYNV